MADPIKKVPNNSVGRRKGKTPDFIDQQIVRWRKMRKETSLEIWTKPKASEAQIKHLEAARRNRDINEAVREQKSFFGVEEDE